MFKTDRFVSFEDFHMVRGGLVILGASVIVAGYSIGYAGFFTSNFKVTAKEGWYAGTDMIDIKSFHTGGLGGAAVSLYGLWELVD
jgi:hypothetical protein